MRPPTLMGMHFRAIRDHDRWLPVTRQLWARARVAGLLSGPEFQLALTPQTDFSLGVADLSGDGIDDILTTPLWIGRERSRNGDLAQRRPSLSGCRTPSLGSRALDSSAAVGWLRASSPRRPRPAPSLHALHAGQRLDLRQPDFPHPIFDGPTFGGGAGLGTAQVASADLNTAINDDLGTGANIGNTVTSVTPVQTVNTSPTVSGIPVSATPTPVTF